MSSNERYGYYQATFRKSSHTETVYITCEEGFQTYSDICGGVPLFIDHDKKTITVYDRG